MKQITEEQIASVMEKIKKYAKSAIIHNERFCKTKSKTECDLSNMSRDKLDGACAMLEILGIAESADYAREQAWITAEEEFYEESVR